MPEFNENVMSRMVTGGYNWMKLSKDSEKVLPL